MESVLLFNAYEETAREISVIGIAMNHGGFVIFRILFRNEPPSPSLRPVWRIGFAGS
jgi:hypothetical protein